jgi:hypothetical protein
MPYQAALESALLDLEHEAAVAGALGRVWGQLRARVNRDLPKALAFEASGAIARFLLE